jgi:hypothetical protein
MGGGSCCLAVLSKAPHPNAAKLFVNWYCLAKGRLPKNTPKSIRCGGHPQDRLAPDDVPQKGVNYFRSIPKHNGVEGRGDASDRRGRAEEGGQGEVARNAAKNATTQIDSVGSCDISRLVSAELLRD